MAAACIGALMVVAAVCFAFGLQPFGPARAGVEAKQTLQDYSWDELASVADEVSCCADAQSAYAVAARYGLCDADGSLADGACKRVELAGGRAFDVVLVGIWHDERTDGGRAGLSFVFDAAPVEHSMNHGFDDPQGRNADSVGGWAASDMRSWLNGDFLTRLPSDLRACLVDVEKTSAAMAGARAETAEPGHLAGSSADWTTVTSDKLWLLSAVELCGVVPERDDLDIDASMARVYAAEGTQYRLFADAGCAAFEPNSSLVRGAALGGAVPCTWWLRTKTLEFGEGFWLVGTDGAVLNGMGEDARALDDDATDVSTWGPDHARGVIAGFCL